MSKTITMVRKWLRCCGGARLLLLLLCSSSTANSFILQPPSCAAASKNHRRPLLLERAQQQQKLYHRQQSLQSRDICRLLLQPNVAPRNYHQCEGGAGPSSLAPHAQPPPPPTATLNTPSMRCRTISRAAAVFAAAAVVVAGSIVPPVSAAAASISSAATAATTATLPLALGWKNVALAASLVLTTGGLGLTLAGVPGTARDVLKACLRSATQLYFFGGVILTHLLTAGNTRPWLVLSWIALTAAVAAQEAATRVEYTYPALPKHLLLAMAGGGGSVLAAALLLRVLGPVDPWFAPRTWIPVAGMVLGNGLTGTALAARCVTKELSVNRDQVELRLSQGATWREAVHTVLQTVYTTSLTPLTNFLSAAGIVHIPGLMTGQILAGQAPLQAAAYQVLVFSLMAACTCLTVQLLTRLAVSTLVDQPNDRLRLDGTLVAVDKSKKRQKKREFLPSTLRVVPQFCSAVKRQIQRRLLTKHHRDALHESANGAAVNGHVPAYSVTLVRTSTPSSNDVNSNKNISEKSPILTVSKMRIARTNMDVSLDVRYDDRIAITGRSGIGKSQVLKTLAGLEAVDRRALQLFDIQATRMSMAEWRSHVVLVPQGRPSLEGTPNQFYKQVMTYASQKVKLDNKKNVIAGHRMSPAEYGSSWGLAEQCFDQQWSSLSGGESQRALLAIALALQPDVLLLDESTSALDEKTALRVEATLKTLRIPVILVSHSAAQVDRFCNQRICLEKTVRRSEVGIA